MFSNLVVSVKIMKSELKKQNKGSGEMMVEAIVACSIIVVGLLGVFTLLSKSLTTNRIVEAKYIGTNLASEGIELVKNLIDRNVMKGDPWNNGIADGKYEMDFNDLSLSSYTGQLIRFDFSSGYYSYDSGAATTFKREIIIQNISNNEIKVVSKVDWATHGGGDVVLEDHFFRWR